MVTFLKQLTHFLINKYSYTDHSFSPSSFLSCVQGLTLPGQKEIMKERYQASAVYLPEPFVRVNGVMLGLIHTKIF